MKRPHAALLATLIALAAALLPATRINAEGAWDKPPMIGMYVHQHWSYNHPYAARTWTLEDWKGYLDGLKKLGFNTVLIWPVLETMPDPLTPSDEENLAKIAAVIDFAHAQDMRALIALCPNVIAKNEEASKYTFVKRPFFYTDQRVNPADAVAMGNMIAWRKQLFTPLKNVDGVLIIDSDPGGYPNSNNVEFVSLLNAHRTMFNELNPHIELYYWIHAGWEAYCRFYATGEFAMGENPEIQDALRMLVKVNPEPWGLASGRGPRVADELGMPERVMSYPYGAIEGEPSFPLTNFDSESAYRVGQEPGVRGIMGNSQTHCIQLPNAFLFARGATGQPRPAHEDYVAFADRLLPGHGETIVKGWEAINQTDPAAIEAARDGVAALQGQALKTGDLEGLLFGDPQRFVGDLAKMLDMRATLERFREAVFAEADAKTAGAAMAAYVRAAEVWQQTHDYKNNWYYPRMEEALMKFDPETFAPFFKERSYRGEGDTPFEQIQNGFKQVETFTPRLLKAMHDKAEALQGQ
jgi:hypothetical protein